MSAAVRRAAGESSISRGVFGGSARALSARDLGTTSVQIKQQGIETEKSLIEARGSLAKSMQDMREFNKTYDLTLREMEYKQREQNLSAIEKELERAQFNASSNLKIMELIATTVSNAQQVAGTMASNDVDPSGSLQTFQYYLDSFQSMLT